MITLLDSSPLMKKCLNTKVSGDVIDNKTSLVQLSDKPLLQPNAPVHICITISLSHFGTRMCRNDPFLKILIVYHGEILSVPGQILSHTVDMIPGDPWLARNYQECFEQFNSGEYSWNFPKSFCLCMLVVIIPANISMVYCKKDIDGLVQKRCNSIANALELHLFCTNPSIYGCCWY